MNQNQLETDHIEIDLLEVGRELLRKWWLILAVAMISMLAAIGITKFGIEPTYESKSMLYVLTNTTSVTSVADLQIGTAITDDFLIIATSKPTVDRAINIIEKEYGKKFTRQEILGMIRVTNEEDTRILTLRAVSTDAEKACMVSNAMAEATAERMAEITKKDPPTVVENAEVEKSPIGPSMQKNAFFGFIIGVLIVCAAIVIQILMNDNIKTEEDIEKYLGETTLATIPFVKSLTEPETLKIRGAKGGKK